MIAMKRFKKWSFNKKVFNVSLNNDFPFCIYDVNTNGQLLPKYSVEIELLTILSIQYNFTFNLVDGKDSWGWLENGTWMGVIGQIVNGTSHMAFCELSQTFDRQQVVDFTHFIFPDQYAAMSQSPLPKRTNFFPLNDSQISITVWLCLFAFFLLLATMISCTAKHDAKHIKQCNRNIFYGEVLVNLYAIYMKVSMHSIHSEKASSNRLLYSSWMISGLVFSTLLSSTFYSSLTVPSFEPAVDSIEDIFSIATSDSRYLLVKDGTSLHAGFMNLNKTAGNAMEVKEEDKLSTFRDVYRQIGLHILRNGQKMLSTTENIVTRAEASRQNVVMAMRITLMTHRYLLATKPLHISSESLESITTGVAFQKGLPLMEPFNIVIDSLREAGVFEYLLQNTVRRQLLVQQKYRTRYAHTMSGNPTQESQAARGSMQNGIFKVVTLFEISSLFLFWVFGTFVGVLVFSFEYFYSIVYRLFFNIDF